MIQIPIDPIPAQEFTVMLGGQPCAVALYQRDDRLYMDLSVGDEPVCAGCVCLNLVDAVQTRTKKFKGKLFFYDALGDTPPRWDGLGSRYSLYYAEDGEEIPLPE